jgi:hypothetical protein
MFRTASPSRYTCMSDLDKVVALSVTVACTVGLELLIFPTGLTEVMVTPPEPPRPAPPWHRTSSSGWLCANSSVL